ncbi:MAG: hypothetical protein KDA61_00465 [Planctomycetales bacterium]|nr:hypothetical protein [Planctomycetales bacterium]
MAPQLTEAECKQFANPEYLGVVCASLLLKQPLANYYVTNITDEGYPFTAVIEMTALVDPQEFGGRSLVYLPRYAGSDDEAWQWSDDEVRNRFVAALGRMYPHFDEEQVEAFRVSRAPHVMALPTLGYSATLPSLSTSLGSVFVVNSAHIVKGTLNVNEVIDLADDALVRLQGALLP